MKNDDILVLARGLAPVIRDLVAATAMPLVERIEVLEREIAAAREATSGVIAEAVERAVSALPVPKDGAPGADGQDGVDGRDGADGAPGKDGVDGRDGQDVDMAEVERMVGEAVDRVLASWERPADGKSVEMSDVEPLIADLVAKAVAEVPAGKDGADGKDGAPGKLPLAKAWDGEVTYEAEVRTHNGALWQAVRDTGREPGHEDWICLATAGAPGKDADQIEIAGTFDPGKAEAYRRLNIVALNGGAFIAKHDAPGECPGEGWQVIAMRGKAGPPGPSVKGDPGKSIKGDPGEAVVSMSIDGQGMLTLVNGDGSEVECDLYPVLSKIGGR
jgi:hypothetical protein